MLPVLGGNPEMRKSCKEYGTMQCSSSSSSGVATRLLNNYNEKPKKKGEWFLLSSAETAGHDSRQAGAHSGGWGG